MAMNRMQVLAAVPGKTLSMTLPAGKLLSTSPRTDANPLEKASIVFDMTVIRTDLKGDYIAAVLTAKGFRVNEATVSKWRSPTYPHLPTYAHIVALGPEFERAYARTVSMVNGYGRIALMDVVSALGDLAEEMSA